MIKYQNNTSRILSPTGGRVVTEKTKQTSMEMAFNRCLSWRNPSIFSQSIQMRFISMCCSFYSVASAAWASLFARIVGAAARPPHPKQAGSSVYLLGKTNSLENRIQRGNEDFDLSFMKYSIPKISMVMILRSVSSQYQMTYWKRCLSYDT